MGLRRQFPLQTEGVGHLNPDTSGRDVLWDILEASDRRARDVKQLAAHGNGPRLLWVHDGFYSRNEPDYQLLIATATNAFQELGKGVSTAITIPLIGLTLICWLV